MKHRLLPGILFALLLALILASCASAPPAGPTLAGQWMPVSAELAGQASPVAGLGGDTLRLTADTYEFASDKGTYSVLSTSPPAQMDIRGTEGPNAGLTIPAIYALDGDQLTICYQLGRGERPQDFTSPKGSQILLVRYKRVN